MLLVVSGLPGVGKTSLARAVAEQRLLARGRRFSHVREPSWAQVQAGALAYEPWHDCETLSAVPPVEQVVQSVLDVTSGVRRP